MPRQKVCEIKSAIRFSKRDLEILTAIQVQFNCNRSDAMRIALSQYQQTAA